MIKLKSHCLVIRSTTFPTERELLGFLRLRSVRFSTSMSLREGLSLPVGTRVIRRVVLTLTFRSSVSPKTRVLTSLNLRLRLLVRMFLLTSRLIGRSALDALTATCLDM